jgi:exopolyphosphatase/guanosine-5'-triphosphate,3'-diphosphate pyrophosphatase
VRYHRKSLPKPTHPEWAEASLAMRAKIEGLAGILRVADGLDRRHLGIVNSLTVELIENDAHVSVEATQDVAPEIAGARFKAELLERSFGVTLWFETPPPVPFDPASFDNEASTPETSAATLSK